MQCESREDYQAFKRGYRQRNRVEIDEDDEISI